MNKGKAVVLMCVIVGIIAVSGATLAHRHIATQQTKNKTSGSGIADYTASIEADVDDIREKQLYVATEDGAGTLHFEVFHIETRQARQNVLRLIYLGPSASLIGDDLNVTYRPVDTAISYQEVAEIALGKPVETQEGEIHAHGIITSMHVSEYTAF